MRATKLKHSLLPGLGCKSKISRHPITKRNSVDFPQYKKISNRIVNGIIHHPVEHAVNQPAGWVTPDFTDDILC